MTPIDLRWFRVKRFLAVLAGPAVNFTMAVAVLFIWQGSWRDFHPFALPLLPRLFVLANIWVMLANLWPFKSKALNLPSDGKQLLQLLSTKKTNMEELQAMRFALEAALRFEEQNDLDGARDWCDKGLALYPGNFHLLNLSGVLWLDQQDYHRAREIFLKLLAGKSQPAGMRYSVLNNIAYADALAGNPEWLAEADAYSKEAYSVLRWVPSIVGTRGTVLVALGNFQEGMKLLKQSFDDAWSPRSKAENACHLAMACARSGNPGEAQKYLELARQLNSQCRLIARTESELGRQTSMVH